MPTLTLISADQPPAKAPLTVEQRIVVDFLAARADGDRARMRFLRTTARAVDPSLLDELDGLDYPAAA